MKNFTLIAEAGQEPGDAFVAVVDGGQVRFGYRSLACVDLALGDELGTKLLEDVKGANPEQIEKLVESALRNRENRRIVR